MGNIFFNLKKPENFEKFGESLQPVNQVNDRVNYEKRTYKILLDCPF
jgi:hypothetical protein